MRDVRKFFSSFDKSFFSNLFFSKVFFLTVSLGLVFFVVVSCKLSKKTIPAVSNPETDPSDQPAIVSTETQSVNENEHPVMTWSGLVVQ